MDAPKEAQEKEHPVNALAGTLVLAVALVFYFAVGDIEEDSSFTGIGAKTFPLTVIFLIVCLSVLLIISDAWKLRRFGWKPFKREETRAFIWFVSPMAMLGFVYVALIEAFQYFLPTLFVTVVTLVLFGNRKRIVVISLAIAGCYYALFFGVLGLIEEPGSVLQFDSAAIFQEFRSLIGN